MLSAHANLRKLKSPVRFSTLIACSESQQHSVLILDGLDAPDVSNRPFLKIGMTELEA